MTNLTLNNMEQNYLIKFFLKYLRIEVKEVKIMNPQF